MNVRHELRTPIKLIEGFCQSLLTQELSAEQRADVEAIYRNAQQLAALIDTLTISPPAQNPVSVQAPQLVVLDSGGAIYELFREYVTGYTVIRVSSAEEIGRLGPEIKPVAIVTNAEDESLIPLLTHLTGKNVPVLTLSFRTSQGQFDFLTKPVQFNELEAILQRGPLHDVLIVDDSRDNVELLTRMLASLPQPPHIAKAFTGREALALLGEYTPDLILLDFVLPDMDSMTIRDYLSLDVRLARIPIVFVSAHRRPDILTLSGASKLTLFQMTALSPLKLAQQIQALLNGLGESGW